MRALEHPPIQFNQEIRLDFEVLISEISSSLVNLPPDRVDDHLNANLQKILDFLQIDRAVLFQKESPEGSRLILTHMKIRPGCGPQVKPFLTTDSFPWLISQLMQGVETKYSRIDDLPDEANVDKETLRQYGPKFSAMAIPMFDGDSFFGVLALGIADERTWPEDLVSRLRVVAHVFSGALIRKKSEERLHTTLHELEQLKTQLERENVYLRDEMNVPYSVEKIVYQSHAMRDVLAKARQVAETHATVLLTGETGTGKEMLAAAIHKWSPRANRAMVRVNCGAIPSALVESEMFGREKGAYTGALTRQIGRFEVAHGSTIFLDEITELPLEAQVKLLRALQERQIERLGSPKPITVDVRVIAATNQNLEKAMQQKSFREDLFYRVNVFPIEVPPLRERREDIPLLVWSFVDEMCIAFGKKVESISQKSMDALIHHSWPGNVRELRNAIERAMIVSTSQKLTVDLPGTPSMDGSAMTLREAETQHIRKVLEQTSWRIRGKNGAAEILGMKPTTLETRMAKLGIKRTANKVETPPS